MTKITQKKRKLCLPQETVFDLLSYSLSFWKVRFNLIHATETGKHGTPNKPMLGYWVGDKKQAVQLFAIYFLHDFVSTGLAGFLNHHQQYMYIWCINIYIYGIPTVPVYYSGLLGVYWVHNSYDLGGTTILAAWPSYPASHSNSHEALSVAGRTRQGFAKSGWFLEVKWLTPVVTWHDDRCKITCIIHFW